jgi:hypothetical protein
VAGSTESPWWAEHSRRTIPASRAVVDDVVQDRPHPVAESLSLIFVAGACLFLAADFALGHVQVGPNRFPLWELFAGLGLIAGVGSIFSVLAPEEEPAMTRGKTPSGRPMPQVRRGPAKRRTAAALPPDDEPVGTVEPSDPVLSEPAVEIPSASTTAPIAPASRPPREVAATLEELDDLELELHRAPYAPRVAHGTPLGGPVVAAIRRRAGTLTAMPSAAGPTATPPPECGSCGRIVEATTAAQCPACRAFLCEVCDAGLHPPPCPSCLGRP